MLERLNAIAEEICLKYEAAYVLLFGSWAVGKMKSYSDIDLAVKLARLPEDPIKVMSDIKWFVEESLDKNADVDVVVLNGLSDSILKYEIYVSGKPLCVNDPVKFFDDKVNAIDEYLDYEPHFRSFFEKALGELHAIA